MRTVLLWLYILRNGEAVSTLYDWNCTELYNIVQRNNWPIDRYDILFQYGEDRFGDGEGYRRIWKSREMAGCTGRSR